MTDHLTWGILGAAGFARTTMAPAIHAARRTRLKSVATRDPSRAIPFAELMPGLIVERSYEALLADPDIDAVYIPLPNSLHTDWSIRAAEAGKHVLCEKPIGMDVADLDRLIATREATGRVIAEGWMPAHHPQWHRTRQMIAEGAIGRLHRVTGSFTFPPPDPSNIRLSADLGGGALRDIGVYPLGGFRLGTGLEPAVHAVDWTQDHGVDTSAWVAMRCGEIRFDLHVSMRAAKAQDMLFHGTEGLLRLPAPFNPGPEGPAQIVLSRGGTDTQVITFPDIDQYVLQVEAMAASVLDGAAFACPLEFSRGTQAILDRILALGAEG
ncbi:Gfo/Idh/MocA family oxidoreductase [Gymnodinialimonas sp. 2305UL16-5]|uniref:Gfo/Idh/MocA family protein n=1 Tax=Gymnodinialimonas mytili TaxID=3126503 RepID=UPI0030A4FAEA